jgi:hypothetical protein
VLGSAYSSGSRSRWSILLTFQKNLLDYPRTQTSISYAADCDVVVCYGNAKLVDKHLAATVHCVDDEIIRRSEQS